MGNFCTCCASFRRLATADEASSDKLGTSRHLHTLLSTQAFRDLASRVILLRTFTISSRSFGMVCARFCEFRLVLYDNRLGILKLLRARRIPFSPLSLFELVSTSLRLVIDCFRCNPLLATLMSSE